jgi:diguanylate cyclase (GGDEF)-like protein/PAS domain S-box-containing protein
MRGMTAQERMSAAMTDETQARLEVSSVRRGPLPDATLARHIGRVAGIFDGAPIGVGVWSIDGELLHANPVQCDLLKQTRAELVGQRFENFIDPHQAATVRQFVEDLWRGERNYFSCELRCRRPDGSELWLRADLTAVYGADARPSYLLSQIFDFSGHRGSPDLANRLTQGSPAMLWLTDDNGIPREGNWAAYAFLGQPELSGSLEQGLFAHSHPDDFDGLARELRKSLKERLPLDFVARARRFDGEWRWLRNQAAPVFAEGGEFVGYAGLSTDVTAYEEMRIDLEETRSLFRSVTEVGPFAVARLDRRGMLTYANRRWGEILDDPQSRLTGLHWQDLLAPDEVREIVELGVASVDTGRAFSYRVLTSGIPHAGRVASDSSEVRYWAELAVLPVYDDDGEHDGWVATLTDVSAEIAAGSRADSLARVLDAGSDFLMIAERNGAISYVNNAASEVLGVRAADPSEPDRPFFLWDVLDADSYEFFHEHVEPVILETGIWRGELVMRAPTGNGTAIPVSALFMAHHDNRGRVESISAVARDISDLKVAQGQLHELATHDYLTGMPNRVLLYDRLEQALARYHRYGQPVALLYLDLDRFKPVNDAHGHHAGDQVLREVASRIDAVVRDTDTAARIGGDEFCVLVEGIADRALLETVAERLIEGVGAPIDIGGQRAVVGVSIGLVSVDERCSDADTLIALADAAMYRAKATGRGRLVVHVPEEGP